MITIACKTRKRQNLKHRLALFIIMTLDASIVRNNAFIIRNMCLRKIRTKQEPISSGEISRPTDRFRRFFLDLLLIEGAECASASLRVFIQSSLYGLFVNRYQRNFWASDIVLSNFDTVAIECLFKAFDRGSMNEHMYGTHGLSTSAI